MLKNKFKHNVPKYVFASVDFFVYISSLFVAMMLTKHFFGGDLSPFLPGEDYNYRVLSHFILGFVAVAWFGIRLRHYTYRKPFWNELKEILRTVIIFAVIDLAIVAFSKWHFSRYLWAFTWCGIFIFIPVGRNLVKRFLKKIGMWKKKTIILGGGVKAYDAYQALMSEKNLGYDIQYLYTVNGKVEPISEDIKLLTEEEDIYKIEDFRNIQFILAFDDGDYQQLDRWLKNLTKKKCRSISVIPTIRGVPLYGTDMAFIFSHEVLLLRVNNNLAKRSSRFVKRTFDIIVSSFLLILLSPLLIYLSLKVKKDGGYAIYGHERVGRKGNLFKCLKFRSMVMNSQEVLQNLLESDSQARDEWEKDFKLRDDPRITPIGKFIRRTSLDELPQLFNVLKGEMSLVGPRPVIAEELLRYNDEADYYLMAKPGMTGLWQVSGRNDVDYEKRVYFDSWYVKNWSLWNDIVILFKTISVVLKRDGAY
ncbi:undecaprenyl-phosphate galactose phosphotransferase WbaP [Citrobacter freundii]|uniref:undecaprenyl-phosphate galactose phosphotransferase WbaP n=1 Tax=Citrobacter freundii TaxID=546 RepID=UPI0028C1A9DF|nr:undecaprenyl-phosphate galactose phosphotransferase WbaP [Citrobacter freundii]